MYISRQCFYQTCDRLQRIRHKLPEDGHMVGRNMLEVIVCMCWYHCCVHTIGILYLTGFTDC